MSLSKCPNDTYPHMIRTYQNSKHQSPTMRQRAVGVVPPKPPCMSCLDDPPCCFFLHLVWKVVLARWQGWSKVSLAETNLKSISNRPLQQGRKKTWENALLCIPCQTGWWCNVAKRVHIMLVIITLQWVGRVALVAAPPGGSQQQNEQLPAVMR